MSKTAKTVMVFLGLGAAVGFGLDGYDLIFGQLDMNRHIPFLFFPPVLVFFTWLVWKVDTY